MARQREIKKGYVVERRLVDFRQGDVLSFEFQAFSSTGYQMVVQHIASGKERRAWILVHDAKGRLVVDIPVQSRFLYLGSGFIRGGWFGSKSKRGLLPLTPRVIMNAFPQFGF